MRAAAGHRALSCPQHPSRDAAADVTGADCCGEQHAASPFCSPSPPNIGMPPSEWNDSHAMPAGSVTQYLSERA